MSLKIADLGLEDTLRELVTDLASSRVYFVELVDTSPDPFTPNVSYPSLLFDCDAISAKVLSADQAFREFGLTNRVVYRFSIATPLEPFKETVEVGVFAFLDFSDGTKVIGGRVQRVDHNLSSLLTVYLDSTENVPFKPLDVGLPI